MSDVAETQPDFSREAERKPKVFIMYRDNQLFQEYMPNVVSGLQQFGRETETHVFEAGTPKEQIKKWVDENRSLLEGKELAVDGTVDGELGKTYEERVGFNIKQQFRTRGSYLDAILEEATVQELLGPNAKEKAKKAEYSKEKLTHEEALALAAECFEAIMKKVAESHELQQIVVVMDCFLDHEPFKGIAENSKSELEALKTNEDFYDQKRKITKRDLEKSSEIMTQWLVSAGIPKERIQIIFDNNSLAATAVDDESTLLIFDRHNTNNFDPSTIVKKAKVVEMPIPSLLDSAYKEGLLTKFDPKKIEDQLRLILEEDFK